MANKKTTSHHARSSRLLELHAEVGTPEPYPIPDLSTGETLFVVEPLTRKRKKALNDAELKLYVLNRMLSGWIARTTEPEPVLVDDPTPEQAVQHANAHAEWVKARQSADTEVKTIQEKIAEASEEYERAFFGDVYDKVIAYFEDKPLLWDKFVPDIKSEFLPAAPADGPDEEAAGKAPVSST